MSDRDKSFIIRLIAITLAVVFVGVVGTMMVGLFDSRVDNAEIFKILGPAFSSIVGAFISVISALAVTHRSGHKEKWAIMHFTKLSARGRSGLA